MGFPEFPIGWNLTVVKTGATLSAGFVVTKPLHRHVRLNGEVALFRGWGTPTHV
ncbi:MAG: hypothetical protein ACJAYU_001464 [Bradymonadia bacterium]